MTSELKDGPVTLEEWEEILSKTVVVAKIVMKVQSPELGPRAEDGSLMVDTIFGLAVTPGFEHPEFLENLADVFEDHARKIRMYCVNNPEEGAN